MDSVYKTALIAKAAREREKNANTVWISLLPRKLCGYLDRSMFSVIQFGKIMHNMYDKL